MSGVTDTERHARAATRPRLGFLGVGWIGLNRLDGLSRSGASVIACVADPAADRLEQAREVAPGAACADSFDELLEQPLDGVVIATPSGLHADQAVRALESGLAVFCQKPLGRTAAETQRVIDAARAADRLLGVDMSYRHTTGMTRIRELIAAGELGDIFAADLVFHNAYGPDKPWFSDVQLAGGGCLMDLGIHLIDLALWSLGFPKVVDVSGHLLRKGRVLSSNTEVEDYATVRLELDTGTLVRIACSWWLPAGRDAVISADFYGTRGGAALRNVDGSFYDFVADRFAGTATERIAEPPDAWGARAALEWAARLATHSEYDPAIASLVNVAGAIDAVYDRSHPTQRTLRGDLD